MESLWQAWSLRGWNRVDVADAARAKKKFRSSAIETSELLKTDYSLKEAQPGAFL
jgi:hypothetical protein